MNRDVITTEVTTLARRGEILSLPAMIQAAGSNAHYAYEEFFAGIDSPHTARAYRNAVHRFLAWCDEHAIPLQKVRPADISGYIKDLKKPNGLLASKPTKKLHLSALRHFFDKLVLRHAVMLNPAASVRGPRHKVTEGKTAALSKNQARSLLSGIDTAEIVGIRDRAIIAAMIYTGVRVGAISKLRRQDFYFDGAQWMFRFDEKGGKVRNIPCRHDLETLMQDWLENAGVSDGEAPLFRSAVRRTKVLSDKGMTENDILRMVKRRFKNALLPWRQLTCHSFRATTITDLLENGAALEDVQYLAGHADPRTTRLYDRRKRAVTRNIVERISI